MTVETEILACNPPRVRVTVNFDDAALGRFLAALIELPWEPLRFETHRLQHGYTMITVDVPKIGATRSRDRIATLAMESMQ